MDSQETPKNDYHAPSVADLGALSEKTLTEIQKGGTSGDVIVIGGQSIPVPGSHLL